MAYFIEGSDKLFINKERMEIKKKEVIKIEKKMMD